jgi:nitroreductase
MNPTLKTIVQRRAVKNFDPVEIPPDLREQILDAACHTPSSLNSQPYRFFWVQSVAKRDAVAKLCLGQKPAATASALVGAVADLGSLAATSEGQLQWMRRSGFGQERIHDFERNAKIGRILFMPGPFGTFAAIKWAVFKLLNLRKVMGMPPLFKQDLFKWATKSTSLACQNLMIAAEALGMNTCPMEGFDSRRLARFLGLPGRYSEIVMVIAIGRKALVDQETPQWRRPLDTTVTFL